MRHNRIVWYSATLVGLIGLISLTAIGANKPEVWKHDFIDAAKVSKQSGRPLLIHFHATWCPPCRQMEKDVLHHSDVRDVLSHGFIAVMIDSDEHPELVNQFEIKSLPTDIVVDSDGVTLLKSEGGRDRKTYLSQMRHVLDQLMPRNGSTPSEIAKGQSELPNSTQQEPLVPDGRTQDRKIASTESSATLGAGQQAPEENPVPVEKLLVGLDRYSPVSLSKHRQWRKGKTEFALVYQGVVYLLYDEAEYREFRSEPSKYAPRLLGCDPVVLWTSDRAIPGSTQFGAYFDGELFLFASPENRDRFKSSPTLYSRPQHVLKVDQIDGIRWR